MPQLLSIRKFLQSDPLAGRVLRMSGNILIAAFWGVFLYTNITGFLYYHKLTLLLFSFSESIMIVLFLIRPQAKASSPYSIDWAIAFVGTFLITLYRPTTSADVMLGEAITAIGILLNIFGLFSLNRSFGIVPAERSIKDGGMYAFIRHPLYASYFVMYVGYAIVNPSMYNICVMLLCVIFQILRIYREEAFLGKTPEYAAYMTRVPWRILPFVY